MRPFRLLLLAIALVISGCDFTVNEPTLTEKGPGKLLFSSFDFDILTRNAAGGDVVLRTRRGARVSQIKVINIASGDSRLITDRLAHDGALLTPFEAAIGDEALFVHSGRGSGENYRWAIDRVDMATGRVDRLIDETGPVSGLGVTSDGTQVFYASQQHERNLRRLDVNSRADTGLATLPLGFPRPYFSAPGTDHLVYTMGDQANLLEMPTGDVVRSVPFAGQAIDVAWASSGTPHLVYNERGTSSLDEVIHVRPMEENAPHRTTHLPYRDDTFGALRPLSAESIAYDPATQQILYWRFSDDRLYLLGRNIASGAEQTLASHTCRTQGGWLSNAPDSGCTVRYMRLSPGQSRLVYQITYHSETRGHFNGDRLFTLSVNG